ncbi:MAG TPA: hypothetical protein VE288_01440 [Rubrobacteraceae bacterium]|nr:hypothetical protein [Rubrobacteraceae bacterium]
MYKQISRDVSLSQLVAEVISNPERELREDLENFARRVEQGELRLSGPSA